MAYKINGKVFTSHPLMDEIVHNCKLILQTLVVKNNVLANDYEEVNNLDEIEMFMMINNGTITFDTFQFTSEILRAYGFDSKQTRDILINRKNVPVYQRDKLVSFASEYFVKNYEEKNKYYRMLMGLPPYGTNEFDVYIDRSYIPTNYTKSIDFSKPLHKQDNDVIAVLQSSQKMDSIIQSHRGSNYSYLRFLGDSKLDLYTARKAGKFDILYIPTVESLVMDRFIELYNLNKEIFLKRTYSEAYSYDSEYYEQTMILMIICQTFNDMIVDVPEWYIRRDIFDIRSVQYFLESFGVEFYKEIPLKYQIRIVKNLNKLIKYKSSNKNFADILEIFALENTSIFKYYLYKKRLRDRYGKYVGGAHENEMYELEFVKAKINESYDDYIKDLIYRAPYDDITYEDKYWDGEDEHSYIRNKHIERDFTIEGTKFMSIEYKVSMSEYLFQMQYFLGLVLESNVNLNDLKIPVPSIQSGINFGVSDLFLFLCLLTLGYDNCNTEVIRPEDLIEGNTIIKQPHKVKPSEEYYDWMKKSFPEFFVETWDRVYGFNTNVNMLEIKQILRRRHSQYQFNKGFTLEDLGVDKYIVATKISSFEDLTHIYFNNKDCYDTLKRKMLEEADDRDEFMTMQYVFNRLFTKQFDYAGYQINNRRTEAEYVEEVLQDRNYILYSTYTKIMSETNMETRRDNIRAIMNDIVNTLEYYLSDDGLEYIFAFTTVASFNSLINYIYLMINFFKSYKVYFLDPFVTYVFDDPLENNARGAGDAIAEKKLMYWKWDREFHRDNAAVRTYLNLVDSPLEQTTEVLDVHGHFDPDPNDDYDYDGMYAVTEASNIPFKDADGGYADPTSCIPYIMLNGGKAQGSKRDTWDLNGAGALERLDYVILDGGGPIHVEDYRKDYWNSHFNYIIDGGSASTNQFITKTMKTQVIDRQIESSVRLSQVTGNFLVEKEDGLYLQESWATWTEFDEFVSETSSTFDYFSSTYNDLAEVIEIINDINALDTRVERIINSELNGMRKVVSYLENDNLLNSLKKYTDDKVQELYDEFYSFNPYSWENF